MDNVEKKLLILNARVHAVERFLEESFGNKERLHAIFEEEIAYLIKPPESEVDFAAHAAITMGVK